MESQPTPETQAAVVPRKVEEVWPDVEVRLLGFLRGRLYGAIRTPATPQSLNLQGLNWCQKNDAHLGEYAHPAAMSALVARCVNTVLPPNVEELELLDTYGRRGAEIRDLNQGLGDMKDPRRDMRKWVLGAGVLGIVAGVACIKGGRNLWGGVSACIGGALTGTYLVSRARESITEIRRARWY